MRQGVGGNEQGSIMVIFALLLVPLLLAVGAGVDYLRLQRIHAELGVAVEAAAVAGAKSLFEAESDEEVFKRNVQSYFVENWWDTHKSVRLGTFSVGVDKEKKIVQISVEAYVPLTIMRLIGTPERKVAATSTVQFKKEPLPSGAKKDLH